MRSLLVLSAALAAPLAACGDPDPAPVVSITAATPEQLAPADDARDDLTITARYDDADGDLGTGTAEVHDCRADGLVTELAIPAIAPEGIAGGEHITGTLELYVNDVGAVAAAAAPPACADLGVADLAADQIVFCVILIDAAGNRGPGDCTAALTLE